MLIQVDKKWINWIISKSDCDIGKIIFVLGSYEYLVRLEGKIRNGIFFCVNKSDNFSVFWVPVSFSNQEHVLQSLY